MKKRILALILTAFISLMFVGCSNDNEDNEQAINNGESNHTELGPYTPALNTITVSGTEYEATHFGSQDLTRLIEGFVSREFWRLENAYEDFRDNPTTGDALPFDNFPMPVEIGQVFVIDITRDDGSVTRAFYRSSGYYFQGRPTTQEFIP